MAHKRLKKLLISLNSEINKTTQLVNKTMQSAIESRKKSAFSPSSSGEQEYAENQAILNKKRLIELTSFREETILTISKTPQIVKEACQVTLKFDSSNKTQKFYFVPRLIYLQNLKLISPQSLLGKAIVNKKTGEKFKYSIKEKGKKIIVKGKVVSIK